MEMAYSHGVRLVDRNMIVDGRRVPIDRVLADPDPSALVSDEGPLSVSRYHFAAFPHPRLRTSGQGTL